MKRLGNIYEDICDLENLEVAFGKVQRGKAFRQDVAAYRSKLSDNLQEVRGALVSGNYALGHYHAFKVFEPKERIIHAAPVRERVIHHAIVNVCGDSLERGLIDDCFAFRRKVSVLENRENRGEEWLPMACKAPENGFYPPCRENHRESRNLLQIGWLRGNTRAVKGVVLDGSCVN